MPVFKKYVILLTLVVIISTINSTIIIVEDAKACFRRALAGKRVARGLVKRSLICERIEDCQRECADEKHFVCEGFNYRLDPTGRDKGECELLDLPLSRLDIGRDIYPDPDYDYYERDRNAATIHCHKGHYRPNEGYYPGNNEPLYYDRPYDRPSGGHDGYFYDRPPSSYGDDRRRPLPPPRPGNYDDRFDSGYGSRPPLRPAPDAYFDRRHDSADRDYLPAPHRFDNNDRRRYPPPPPSGSGPGGDGHRRGDFAYDHHSHHHTTSSSQQHHHSSSQQSYHFNHNNDYRGIHYLPPNPDYHDRNRPTYNHDQRPPPYYYNHRAPPPQPPHHHQQQHHDLPYDYKSYEPYLPPPPNDTPRRPPPSYNQIHKYYIDREKDQNYWGYNRNTWGSSSYGHYGGGSGGSSTSYHSNDYPRKNYYLPSRVGGTKDWGQYGGSYGNGGFNLQYNGYGHSQTFDYWGFDKYDARYNSNRHNQDRYDHGAAGGLLPPHKRPAGSGDHPGGYLPAGKPLRPPQNGGGPYLAPRPPPGGGSYLPEPPPRYPPPQIGGGGSYLPDIPPPKFPENRPLPPLHGGSYLPHDNFPNSLLPAEPRYPGHSFKDECSLRSATGFKLHKGIVKKFFAVPSLYECELLCFKEKEFPCASYAYRYTVSLSGPTDNCYLSNRNYKKLDHYTDLQPDRDFDIYTMNNQKKCEQPLVIRRSDSECFWRVRSAARLDHAVVRDSLTTKSIVECQIECLKSRRFTCRAFSFRYGSPIVRGAIDNCQLTDWPYHELDPKIHFIPEPGFELYERGSFGHGCEPYHFGVRGNKPWKDPGTRADQLCYIGFGHPAKILPQATKKAINVPTEHDCKVECSKLREQTLFQCMSFSYRTDGPHDSPNCLLSDILQRDLLPHVDYVPDPDWWLFAWDNYNPECVFLANEPVHNHIGKKEPGIENRKGIFYDPVSTLDTWRIYSVSGWPCRQGTFCQENREAGFWFCELEGGDANTWDYCCRPNHQCGYSEGFSYQWCYVGPVRTQWRKCSERYYPYIHNLIDRVDGGYGPPPHHPHVPASGPPPQHGSHHDNLIWDKWSHPPSADNIWRPSSPPYRPGLRPDRPQAPPTAPPPRPSLDEFEMQFDTQFLEPPKPGGFGQPRRWPVSYLHMEKPPNSTMTDTDIDNNIKLNSMESATRGRSDNPKFQAIQNLIDVIKSNDLKNVQYQITNESNKEDDILFVKIPLPTNFTQQEQQTKKTAEKSLASLTSSPANMSQPIDLKSSDSNKRSQKSLPSSVNFKNDSPANKNNGQFAPPVYRRSYITRTNVTNRAGDGNNRPQFSRSFRESQ